MIEIDEVGEWYRLDYRKSKYIIAEDQYTKVYTETNEYLFRKKLTDWEELLPKDLFCRINRSVMVAFPYFERKQGGIMTKEGHGYGIKNIREAVWNFHRNMEYRQKGIILCWKSVFL